MVEGNKIKNVAKGIKANDADFLKAMAGGGVGSKFDHLHLQSPSPEEMAGAVQVAKEYGTYAAIHAYTEDAYLKRTSA